MTIYFEGEKHVNYLNTMDPALVPRKVFHLTQVGSQELLLRGLKGFVVFKGWFISHPRQKML